MIERKTPGPKAIKRQTPGQGEVSSVAVDVPGSVLGRGVVDSKCFEEEYFEGRRKGEVVGFESYTDAVQVVRQQYQAFSSIAVDVFHSGKVLDLGCAYGHSVATLLELGIDAYGVDFSSYAIATGLEMYPQLSVTEPRIWLQDIRDPFNSWMFRKQPSEGKILAAVTSSETLEHIKFDELPALMESLASISEWGFFVLVCAMDEKAVPEYAASHPDKTHQHCVTKSWWVDFLRQYGELDWQRMHDFAKIVSPFEPALDWGKRFFAVHFNS